MNITIFLAQLWGPVLLAIGIGILTNRSYYVQIYKDFEKSSFAIMLFGLVAMVAGTAQIYFHNSWGTLMEGLISFLGWGMAIKGTLFLIAPKFVKQIGNGWANLKLVPIASALALITGGYLTWIGYLG